MRGSADQLESDPDEAQSIPENVSQPTLGIVPSIAPNPVADRSHARRLHREVENIDPQADAELQFPGTLRKANRTKCTRCQNDKYRGNYVCGLPECRKVVCGQHSTLICEACWKNWIIR